jgi:hypothetical protein
MEKRGTINLKPAKTSAKERTDASGNCRSLFVLIIGKSFLFYSAFTAQLATRKI